MFMWIANLYRPAASCWLAFELGNKKGQFKPGEKTDASGPEKIGAATVVAPWQVIADH